MTRAGIALALVLLGGMAVWWVMDMRADNAALERSLAAAQRELAVSENIAEQARTARDVARATAERHKKVADDLSAALDAYRTGDCDATDPACAIGFINERLRNPAPR